MAKNADKERIEGEELARTEIDAGEWTKPRAEAYLANTCAASSAYGRGYDDALFGHFGLQREECLTCLRPPVNPGGFCDPCAKSAPEDSGRGDYPIEDGT